MTARFDLAVLEEPGLEFGYGQRLEHPKDGLLLKRDRRGLLYIRTFSSDNVR